ncbi:xanthine dehydrogenase HxA [Blumeria hordei DH14]|uniref:xanthine dehydrogenase n=1 Tax=Blumeria graminis f. sp. hordei (strain DH14) TaxID=546991 RepID=N1JCB6_BLUG1|nr:xanthine dehydrogenase HxA [Blumeria hordei DH14]
MPSLSSITDLWGGALRFYLNGTSIVLDRIDPNTTLLEYIREIGLTGTKLGCAEGGCGACTVVISQYNPTTHKIYHASVNACLAPLISVDGKHVITIEGIGTTDRPHLTQERIARGNGSQCGFCTPGIVMSLYALLRNNSTPSAEDVEETFDGNLCRCTGYRPILDAAQTFSVGTKCCKLQSSDECCMAARNDTKNFEDQVIERNSSPSSSCHTPPQLIKYDHDTELIFPPALTKHDFKPLVFGGHEKKWFRPVTVKQLLEIKNACPSAKIVSGSTEHQIELRFKAMQHAVSIYVGDIPELKEFTFQEDYVDIGGNVTLTDLETIALEAVDRYGPARAQVFSAIYKQLGYFAGRQIRNVGTPAGNLVTASPISDLNPIFLAANATIITKNIEGQNEIEISQFFSGYRKTVLPTNSIIFCIRIPILSEVGEFFQSYKHSKRKDDDIAIVNAAFKVTLSKSNVIKCANLVYGGMAPTTIVAKNASAFLNGKKINDTTTIEGVMDSLEEDFNLSFSVPGGMATFRRSLAFGFFYRFYNEILSKLNVENYYLDQEEISEIKRKISTGWEDKDCAISYQQRIVGKSEPHLAALKQTCGEAQYTDDLFVRRNELFGSLVLSTKAHAKILSVDYLPALEIPGVVDWLDHTDMPSPKANFWGAPVSDETFFAVDEVFTAGQPIGIVLASTPHSALQGSRAVKVKYDELPAILTIEEAIKNESYFQHSRYIKKGDTKEAFSKADNIFTGFARIGGQEHFYLETQACVAIPKPEDGEMEIYASTQNPTETQTYVAQVCNISANKVVCKVKRLGGGFGGKETRSVQLSAIVALAAKKTGRPVRCQLNRDEDMITSGQRHPFLARWRVGVHKDGKLQALEADVFCNAGWSQDLSAAVCDRALSHIDGCYNIPNVNVRGRLCKTNTMSNTAFRGFGGPQGIFIAETFMEEIADRLDIPVETLRQINLYKPGDSTHFNQTLEDWHVPLMYQQVQDESLYAERRKEVTKFNSSHRWKKRGLSLIPTKFGISFTALFLNQAGALVHVYQDGSILVAHGGTEMGQGLHTKMTMIAAEALGVPMSAVFISETATNTVANTSSTAASASSDLNGYAILDACNQINTRLVPYRAKLGPQASMKELAHAAYLDRVNLSANGFYKTPDIGYIWGQNTGQMFFYFTQGVAMAEVEVDTLTGEWTCLRADVKMDVGKSINPSIDYGQIQGAFVQGMGLFTSEESLWYESGAMKGQLATRGPGTYKIPGFRDIPQEFNVSLLKGVEWKNLRTIQRSRGVGEPPLFLGSAVFFAIRDSLKAARSQYGTSAEIGVDEGSGLLRLVSPATTERIRTSCVDPIVERARVKALEGERSFFVSI